jgi:diphosphomevalonate decarboxylase
VLNGKEENFENERITRCVEMIKQRAAEEESCSKEMLTYKIHVDSENNFPTAAGLASSASGYACLVYALAQLYGLKKQEISDIARMGSGSACRSIYGGFVQWHKGVQLDGKDSIAVQIAPASHWPDLHVLILVVNDSKKKIGSTSGMRTSVLTSELIKYRVEKCVPQRIHSITQAIKDRDFSKFAEITMKDSNQFHAICLDTYPPCVYMNDVSHVIVNYVHEFNRNEGETKVAYTFDAGPNACIYLPKKYVKRALAFFNHVLPNDNQDSVEYVRGTPVELEGEVSGRSEEVVMTKPRLNCSSFLGNRFQQIYSVLKECVEVHNPHKGWRWAFSCRIVEKASPTKDIAVESRQFNRNSNRCIWGLLTNSFHIL